MQMETVQMKSGSEFHTNAYIHFFSSESVCGLQSPLNAWADFVSAGAFASFACRNAVKLSSGWCLCKVRLWTRGGWFPRSSLAYNSPGPVFQGMHKTSQWISCRAAQGSCRSPLEKLFLRLSQRICNKLSQRISYGDLFKAWELLNMKKHKY